MYMCKAFNNGHNGANGLTVHTMKEIKKTGLLLAIFFANQGIINAQAPQQVSAIDLGLPSGTLWANMNIGANSVDDYGRYYDWSSCDGRYGSKESSKHYKVTTETNVDEGGFETTTTIKGYTKYVMSNSSSEGYNGFFDNIDILDSEDDAATVNWGKDWRIPTDEEYTELRTHCKWIWGSINGINGYKVIGPNNNYIFLPASGVWGNSASYPKGGGGGYWSSTLSKTKSSGACSIQFTKSAITRDSWWTPVARYYGMSIRPVSAKVNDSPIQTCATPTISLKNGKLVFDCSTDGVSYISEIKCDDVAKYDTNNIQLNPSYNVSVIAKREAYNNSEMATATIIWATDDSDCTAMETIKIMSRPLLIKQCDEYITVECLNNNEKITICSINGSIITTSQAIGNIARINISSLSGQTIILKVGNKSAKLYIK